MQTSCSWATDRSGFVVNSFSKYFSMTGWRIGWLLVPRDLSDVVDALGGNLAICPPAPAQYAALAAFDAYDECDGHVTRYAANRRAAARRAAPAGHRPARARRRRVLRVRRHLAPDRRFRGVLRASCWTEAGVAAAPGIDFDQVDGHRFLRFSFAGSTEPRRRVR